MGRPRKIPHLPGPKGYHWDRSTPVVLRCGSRPCRWCKGPIPPGRRKTFCSDFCVGQWKRRTDPDILRWETYRRDRGICQDCHLDLATVDVPVLQQQYNLAGPAERDRLMQSILAATAWRVKALVRVHTFECDHIVPLALGGDPFDPSNLRTLCLPCHRIRNAALNTELARRRVRARREGVPVPSRKRN
jgi:5-methylcytosine-specific restriction endonuclease McrA